MPPHALKKSPVPKHFMAGGEGEWSDPDTVANEVTVRVRMVLPPVK